MKCVKEIRTGKVERERDAIALQLVERGTHKYISKSEYRITIGKPNKSDKKGD